jgi:hypothetical protein
MTEIKIKVEYKDHDKVILTNSKGDTYTSKSEELADFLHSESEPPPAPGKYGGSTGEDIDDTISKYVGNPSRLLRRDVTKAMSEWANIKSADKDAEIERLKEFVMQFLQDPYPEDVFLPVSKQELTGIHEMLLKEFNMPLDRLTGHIGRLLRNPLMDEAKKLLSNH